MKTLYFFFGAVILAAALIPGSSIDSTGISSFAGITTTVKTQGYKYKSGKGKYEVTFPGKPEISKEKISTAVGKVKLYTAMYVDGSYVYMVAYSAYPKKKIQNSNPEDMLDGAIEGYTGKLNMTITEKKSITIDSYPGVMIIASSSKYHTVMRDYMVDNRLFQVGILSENEIPESRYTEFYDSFKLNN